MSGHRTHDTAQPRWRRLSPLTVWAGAAATGALVVLPALVAAAVTAFAGVFLPWGALIPLAAVLIAGALIGAEILRYRRTRYRATEERMEVRSGLLFRTHLSLPRDRIRSVDLAMPLWGRPFGLCSATVGTGQNAESGGDELRLAYLDTAEGERLRRELLYRALSEAQEAEGTAAGTAASELARMRPPWFGYGAAAPGPAALAYSLVLSAAVSLAQFFLPWLLDLYTGADTGPGTAAVAATVLSTAAGVIAAAGAATLALHTEAWWNYRLTREPDGTFKVERGLLNLVSVSIEERRLRGVELRAPLPLRWTGAASVAAVASGLGGEGGTNTGLVPKRTLSPPVPREEAERLLGAVLPGAGSVPLTAHPGAALRRRLVRAVAAAFLLAAAVAGLALFTAAPPLTGTGVPEVPLWSAAAVFALAAPAAGLYAWGCYQGLGHGLSEHHLYLRRGMAARSTAVLRREAVIGWTIRRSPFQRWAGLATVGATIAADKGVFHAADTATGQGLALAHEAVPGLLAPFLERR